MVTLRWSEVLGNNFAEGVGYLVITLRRSEVLCGNNFAEEWDEIITSRRSEVLCGNNFAEEWEEIITLRRSDRSCKYYLIKGDGDLALAVSYSQHRFRVHYCSVDLCG